MKLKESQWKTVARPGWFGERRDSLIKSYNKKYGNGNWRIRHQLGPYILDSAKSLRLYELCYELHFLHPDKRYLWNNLINTASDVWTERITDIESGTDYSIQKAPAAHYEDISIRIILQRHGLTFKGDKLIRIRADAVNIIGVALSSIHIPFLYPEYIEAPLPGFHWWDRHKGSLEEFWHLNKILQVKK